MLYLVGVTILWAFSFSLIGVYLSGQVDPYFAVLSRIVLACLVFMPFLVRQPYSGFSLKLKLLLFGAIQLGLMYLFYYQSFLLLTVPEVLVFTIFTPVYITLLYDLSKRRFNRWFFIAAVLAVAGAAIMRYDSLTEDYWLGFLVVQAANLCFASGQVGYKLLLEKQPVDIPQHSVFGWFYIGALLVAFPAWLLFGSAVYPEDITQWAVLLWLGLVASGGGFFWWNKGATQVSSGMLAIMNNALIPAGLLVNVAIWNQSADLSRLFAGSLLLLVSWWLCHKTAFKD